jgi:HlyD family secretion protein
MKADRPAKGAPHPGCSAQYVETRPEKRNIVNSYSADGTITAADTYTVKPMVKDTVLTADFEVGDTVNKGDVRHLRFELPRDDAGRR